MQSPDFWNDQQNATKISQQVAKLKEEVLIIDLIKKELQDIQELSGLDSGQQELQKFYLQLQKRVTEEEVKIFLSGKYDKHNAILEIFSGAGGQDAQDWATILLRMYQRYCATKGFKISILHQSFGDGGGPDGRIGTKSVTMEIKGKYAYGFLKKEAGVHRLVRLSPFNSQKLRHTSFALVELMPEIEENMEFEIKPEELRIDTFRASGPGGQHVNKTESAIRITHLPTGISVASQSERSQGRNKEYAMKILYSKLYQLKEQQHKTELREIKATQEESGRASPLGGGMLSASWGNQIRSYVLHPYQMVKDLRTQFETSDTQGVLDGNLEDFINAELKMSE